MAIYWTSNNIPGYISWSNGSWSDFMNAYARHPYDTNANANNLPDVYGSTTITAPYSGTYEFCGAADNYGALDIGGQNRTINGFTHSGKCKSKYYNKGDTIALAWNFGNAPSSENFTNNPSAISLRLTGPDAPPAPTASLSIDPTAIIQGGSVTLTWSSTNGTSFSLTDVANPGSSGSATLTNITAGKTYTYTVTNEASSATATKTLTVYVPPTINVTADNPTIIVGGSTTIRWSHTGDASYVSWTSGGLTNTNLNSNSVVSPTTTTSYCAVATGLGGTSPENCATVTVYAQPYIEKFEVPAVVNYGAASFNVEYETKYANVELKIEVFHTGYTSGPDQGSSILEQTYVLTTAASAENGSANADANGTITYSPQWDNFGPRTIVVRLSGTGQGGSFVDEKSIPVAIDETPDNITIPESDDLLKDADPVITPESEILTEWYLIEDIDIPVEIKSDWPILVDKNLDGTWTQIRQI